MIYSVIPYETIFAQDHISVSQIKYYHGMYFEMDENGPRRLISTNPRDFLMCGALPTAQEINQN